MASGIKQTRAQVGAELENETTLELELDIDY